MELSVYKGGTGRIVRVRVLVSGDATGPVYCEIGLGLAYSAPCRNEPTVNRLKKASLNTGSIHKVADTASLHNIMLSAQKNKKIKT